MHLKSIDLQGFKSFAHKIQLVFNDGITGIVGPNGSGKSNIADAVRWVLGEQSAKQLRGSKMEDVIFAGTENRKSVGYSQVSIEIDNHDRKLPIDYSEVIITRRVYRSGESDYYINRSSCRLKDIIELLMDTGIGKEGYSIIGQGQIDKILSHKPEDRRLLFDEAAGIVKFKKRKEGAVKKLEEQKQNLFRVNDIIVELENQKDQLCEQSDKAKEFLKLKENLKTYEINSFLNEYSQCEEQINSFIAKEKITICEIEEAKDNYNTNKADYERLNIELETLNESIDKKKELMARLSMDKEKVDHSIKLAKEQMNSIVNQNSRLQVAVKTSESKLKECNIQKESHSDLTNQFNQNIEEKNDELLKEEAVLKVVQEDIRQNETTVESSKTNIIERMNEISSIKGKIQRYKTIEENLMDRKTTLDEKSRQLEQSTSTQQAIKTSKENGLLLIKKTLDNIQVKKTEIEEIIHSIDEQKKTTVQKLNDETKQYHQYTSRYHTLRDITSQYDGYTISIKKIMQLKKTNPHYSKGIHGVVADTMQVAKKYELAIETALGGSIQNIITTNENIAKECIQYLKKNKYGRATFLPMSSVKPRGQLNVPLLDEQGVIGLACDLVEVAPSYRGIIRYLLGRVVVVNHIDHAICLARKYKYSVKMVTLTGDIINPGGSLTGGSYKNKGNHFLGRKRELEEIKKQLDEIAATIEISKREKDSIKQKEDLLRQEASDLAKEENQLKLEYQGEELKLNQIVLDMEKMSEAIDDITQELSEITMQNKDIEASVHALELELKGSEDENNNEEKNIQALIEVIQGKKKKQEMLSNCITQIKLDINSLEQKQKHLIEDNKKLEQSIQEIAEEVIQNKAEIMTNQEALIAKQQIISDSAQSIQKLDSDYIVIQNNLEELTSQKTSKSGQLTLLFELLESTNEKINVLEKENLKLQNAKIKFDLQIENLINYMWEEYELTYSSCLDFKEDLGTTPSIKKSIQALKEQIKVLGDVNVNAIEDYKSVIERYTFLTEQKEDILDAEAKLMQVIEDLNHEMTKQFKQKFSEIMERFNEVFRELFGGGKGLLKLTDEDNLLQSGIHITAQPPGKKLQSMMLLSGGERAFTAIALLFAIQSLKPSPFCVLDEIEAALDDANVERFANYLKKLSKQTQFIIITHRRGTMEAADTLYGITMQEKGISSLVSVKLVEKEL